MSVTPASLHDDAAELEAAGARFRAHVRDMIAAAQDGNWDQAETCRALAVIGFEVWTDALMRGHRHAEEAQTRLDG